MKLIIDGYNLIRSVTHKRATEPDIQHMLGRLRRYQRVTQHEIVIVFDGGDGTHRYQTGYHGLTVWYSGVRETADDLIKDFLRTAHPDGTVLISDDRQLNEAAQERDIVSVSPLLFLARIKEREGVKPGDKEGALKAIKTSAEANVEVDALMEAYSGTAGSKKEGEQEITSAPKHKKGSKVERRLEALMRKL
jgi:predicted RNA-binding protein with PIN domain